MNKGALFIARHGETEANITKAIVGITDVQLTEKGKQDAHYIGTNTSQDIDLIITSPQTRAVHSAEIIRKYHNVPIVEHPLLHPQNFGVIEGLTLDEARKMGLGNNLHAKSTNKYLHKAEGGESAQEMESRTIKEIYKLLELSNQQAMNILLVTHNSISRCLIGNANGVSPDNWVNDNIGNDEIFSLDEKGTYKIKQGLNNGSIENLLSEEFGDIDFTKKFGNNFLNRFAKLSLNEEMQVLNYLMNILPGINNIYLKSLIKLLENTIALNQLFSQIKIETNVSGVYSVLQFGSSIYGKNYSVKDYTDLDIEIIIDENFDINSIKDTVLGGYNYGDITEDFSNFLESGADYFSFKATYNGRLVDFRITHKECYNKICNNSLEEGDEYIMKEFRRQFRENGIVPGRKDFTGNDFTWKNDIEYNENGQIIYYPLFRYSNGNFVAGNNLDKYCSFTEGYLNEIEIKKKMFELRKRFNTIFQQQRNSEKIGEDSNITNIFVRKNRFPNFLIEDLEYRYRIYNILFNS